MSKERKNQLSELMHKAWLLVKVYGFTMAEALKKSWAINKLRQQMRTGVVKFLYSKLDGTTRTAWGTMQESIIAPVQGIRKSNQSVCTYWDMEKQSYRCFKIANFIKIV